MNSEKKVIDELKEYRDKLSKLTEEEQKKRDLHLKQLADGTLQGPNTGYSSIDKQWLQYYTDEAITSDLPKMLACDYLVNNNKDNLENVAINYFGLKLTYKELFDEIEKTEKSLAELGVKKGDVVVINSVTLPQSIFLLYALNKLGAVANLTDLRSDAKTMKHYLNEGNSKYVFTLDACYDGFKEILSETSIEKVVLLNPKDIIPGFIKMLSDFKDNKGLTKEEKAKKKSQNKYIKNLIKDNENIIDWNSFCELGKKCKGVIEVDYEENYPAAIVHTSGTTNLPKSVILTNENFNAMALQYSVSDFKYANNESLLNIIPIFTAYGVVNSLHMPLCLGMINIVYPKVVNDDFTDILLKFKPNHVIAIPMHWEYILKNKNFESSDLSFLKTAGCGGDKLNVELEKELNDFLAAHGSTSKIVKGYGMTEVSACAVTNTNQTSKIGSVGIPLVKNNIKIVDPETKKEVPTGQQGEIYIQTPSLMKEYLNNKEETNKIIQNHDDGKTYIQSGDLGHIESDGNVYIDGRLKRLIIRRGFKVSAVSIEEVIMKDSRVQGCAVVKAPDKEDGEIPYVHIALKPEYKGQESDVQRNISELCMVNLPEYYVPNQFNFVDELPYTANAKLDYLALEKMAIENINVCEEKCKVM